MTVLKKLSNLMGLKKENSNLKDDAGQFTAQQMQTNENQEVKNNYVAQESELNKLLKITREQTYYDLGKSDGYNFGSEEFLTSRLKELRANFIQNVNKEIEEKEQDRFKLKIELEKAGTVSDTVTKMLNEAIAMLEQQIKKLEQQKILAVDDEGYFSKIVYEYRNGFAEGLLIRLKENKIFKI